MTIKYLGYNIPVLLTNGDVKLAKDLKNDDILVGINSENVKIMNIKYISNDMYRIIPRYGKSFVIGWNHNLITIKNKTNEIQCCNVNEYRTYNDKSIIKTNIDFNYIKIDIDPYFLGIWLGSDLQEFKLNINKIDKCIYTYILSMINKLNLSFCNVSEELIITDKRIIDYFVMLDLMKRKYIPKEYKYNKSVFRLRLLAGILDIRGIYNVLNAYYEVSGVEELIKDSFQLTQFS